MNLKPANLQYLIFSKGFCRSEFLGLYEQAYNFWFQNWKDVYRELKAHKEPSVDDFFRQNFIPAIFDGDRIVAIHLYTLYDLRPECSLRHSYLSHNFNRDYFLKCRELGLVRGMSMEALFVDPEYRRSKSGVHLSEILISLGQRLFLNMTDADVILAPARSDVKVSRTACGLGFEPIQKDVKLNNVPVDLLICRREKVRPPQNESLFFVEHMWRARIDAVTGESEANRKSA